MQILTQEVRIQTGHLYSKKLPGDAHVAGPQSTTSSSKDVATEQKTEEALALSFFPLQSFVLTVGHF